MNRWARSLPCSAAGSCNWTALALNRVTAEFGHSPQSNPTFSMHIDTWLRRVKHSGGFPKQPMNPRPSCKGSSAQKRRLVTRRYLQRGNRRRKMLLINIPVTIRSTFCR